MEEFKKKTSREHILERPNMYIGAVNNVSNTEYIIKDNKITNSEITYIPGLVKIINEIIDNSVDISIKTDFKGCNKIEVNITDSYVEVIDNGPGIPVVKNSDNEYIPFMCWGYAMSGSNFDNDENRKHIGMNGVGSYCTNVWSKKFTGISDDGKNRYEVTFKDNASSYVDTVKKSQTNGVYVKFYPDLERFGIESISDVYRDIIKTRLINLNMSFPKIKFVFNSEKIKFKNFDEYISLFDDNSVTYETDDYSFAIYTSHNEEFNHYTFVNGLFTKDGGTHVDFIKNYFANGILEKLSKKYNIKRSDVVNRISIVAFLNNLANAKFNSQTKEKITNTNGEISKYFNADDWNKVLKQVLNNESIIDPIINSFKMRDDFERKLEIKKLNKTKKVKYDKYIPSSVRKKYLMIVEGESALGSLMPAFGIEECGYFMLKGKPLNAWKITQQKFISNVELSNLYTIIKSEGYEQIVFATDEDLDGIHIRSLLSGFVRKYLKEFQDKIGILETPIIAVFKNEKIQRWTYSLDEKLELKNNESSFYFKGLGSWEKDDLQIVIKTDGVSKMIVPLEFTDCDESLDEWLGTDSEPRKKYIIKNEFSIVDL